MSSMTEQEKDDDKNDDKDSSSDAVLVAHVLEQYAQQDATTTTASLPRQRQPHNNNNNNNNNNTRSNSSSSSSGGVLTTSDDKDNHVELEQQLAVKRKKYDPNRTNLLPPSLLPSPPWQVETPLYPPALPRQDVDDDDDDDSDDYDDDDDDDEDEQNNDKQDVHDDNDSNSTAPPVTAVRKDEKEALIAEDNAAHDKHNDSDGEPTNKTEQRIDQKDSTPTKLNDGMDSSAEENTKLIVYGAPPGKAHCNPHANKPGNRKYRELIAQNTATFQKCGNEQRQEITDWITGQFLFFEHDGTTETPRNKVNSRLKARLATNKPSTKSNTPPITHVGKRKRRSSSSSSSSSFSSSLSTTKRRTTIPNTTPVELPRPQRRSKTRAMENITTRLLAEQTTVKPSFNADEEIVDYQNQVATVPANERPRKRAKVVPDYSSGKKVVPPETRLTVYGGTGQYRKKGNVAYQSFLENRQADYEAGRRGELEIIEEGLTCFSFVSRGKKTLDSDEASAKIAKDLGCRRKPSSGQKGNAANAKNSTTKDLTGGSTPSSGHVENANAKKSKVAENPQPLRAPAQQAVLPTTKAAHQRVDEAQQILAKLPPSDLPTVLGGTGFNRYEGNLLFANFLDSRREEYISAKRKADKAKQEEIMGDVIQAFRFVHKNGGIMTQQEVRAKIYKNIADERILERMRKGGTKARKPISVSVLPTPPPELYIPKESHLLAEYDSSEYFIEELSYHALAGQADFESLGPLPPPPPLPNLPTHEQGRAKYSFYDEYSYVTAGHTCRIIHVDCTGLHRILPEDKEFIGRLMQRDDMFVLFQGLCRGVSEIEILNSLYGTASPGPASKVRQYDKIVNNDGFTEYVERDKYVGISVDKYVEYWDMVEKSRGSAPPNQFCFKDHFADTEVTLDPSKAILYMTDVDLTDRLTTVHDMYQRHFLFPEILPGGEWCMTNLVPKSSRTFVGPNLYLTPGGGYTQIHQDGHGTIDSGHTCISGYNEVLILRRLPEQHKLRACSMIPSRQDVSAVRQAKNMLYRLPHDDKREDKPSWPTIETIDEMNKMNYCATVFTIGADQHLHIPQGCLHAFRKMTCDPLPQQDCHYTIRRKLVEENGLVERGSPLCVSIAFDWMYAGVEADAVNRLCAARSECQSLSRKHDTAKPLAVAEAGVIYVAKEIKSCVDRPDLFERLRAARNISKKGSETRKLDLVEMARGILPTLRYIVERDAVDKRGIRSSSFLTFAESPDDRFMLGNADPYGVDGFRCGACSIELSHAYFHCDGCEYSGKDFNICTDCYVGRMYLNQPHYDFCTCGPGSSVPCECREVFCNIKGCTEGRKPCSCSCHEKFHRRTRFFTDDEIRELVKAAEKVADGKEVKYHEETLMRLEGKVMVRPGEVEAYVAKRETELAAPKEAQHNTPGEMEVEPIPGAKARDVEADSARRQTDECVVAEPGGEAQGEAAAVTNLSKSTPVPKQNSTAMEEANDTMEIDSGGTLRASVRTDPATTTNEEHVQSNDGPDPSRMMSRLQQPQPKSPRHDEGSGEGEGEHDLDSSGVGGMVAVSLNEDGQLETTMTSSDEDEQTKTVSDTDSADRFGGVPREV